MDVSLNHSVSSVVKTENPTENQRVDKQEQPGKQPVNQSVSSLTDKDIQQAIDKATGLLQTIVTDKISDDVIRKVPADEYLSMLTLLDDVINGSVDENV